MSSSLYSKDLECFNLTPTVRKLALEELGETPEKGLKCLQEIREMMKADGGFHCSIDGSFLLRYLRVHKYDVEKAFKAMKNYLKIRRTLPEIFYLSKPSDLFEKVYSQNIFSVLKEKTDEGALISVVRLENWDTKQCSLEELICGIQMLAQHTLRNATIQVLGVVAIFDFKGFGLKHMQQVTPAVAFRLGKLLHGSAPLRYRAIHFVNESIFVDMAYAVVSPFLSKKLRNRITFHGREMSTLHERIPAKLLPEEFDGEKGPFKSKDAIDQLIKDEKFVANYNRFYYSKDDPQEDYEE